jgi:putative ABC transport system permease protein
MMTERLSDGVAAPRLHAGLLSVFGAVALLLAAIGLYGVLAYTVSQREHEIGIRMALGAGKRQVLTLIMKRGMGVVLVGIAVGIPASLALGRAMSGLLYQIRPADLETIFLVTLLLGFVAFLACWVPARRASRVHPMTALRAE